MVQLALLANSPIGYEMKTLVELLEGIRSAYLIAVIILESGECKDLVQGGNYGRNILTEREASLASRQIRFGRAGRLAFSDDKDSQSVGILEVP